MMHVANWKTLDEEVRRWLTGSLSELACTRDVRGGDVLCVIIEVVRAAILCERNTSRCALNARAGTWRVVGRGG